jgi:hypothetical protein
MPFYFRIPLPGPFGYSHRIGGRRRKRPTRARTYAATREGWSCQHAHRTPNAAELCGLRYELRELEKLAGELLELDTDGLGEEAIQHYKATGERLLAQREGVQRQIRELS